MMGDLPEPVVAELVAEGIGDFFEAIEAHHQQRERRAVRFRILDESGKALVQAVAAGKAGELVVFGLMEELRVLAREPPRDKLGKQQTAPYRKNANHQRGCLLRLADTAKLGPRAQVAAMDQDQSLVAVGKGSHRPDQVTAAVLGAAMMIAPGQRRDAAR